MATKSIIDIEVNDSQFKAFYEIYQKFQEKIESLPEDSKAAFGAIAAESKKSVNHASQMGRELDKATKAQKQFHQATIGAEKSMSNLVSKSAQLSKNIFGIGKWLMKMGVIGTGFAAGGLFGLDALGRAAVGGQRQARGLGITQGQMRAFGTDFGRYVSPNLLSNVAGAQADFSKRAYLSLATGTSYQQAATMNPAQLAIQSAMRAHEWWQKTPANLRTQQSLAATGLSQIGYTMEDVRRLGNTPLSELQAAQKQYGRDTGTLGISDKTTQDWYKLTRQVRLAGQTIEAVLINKLSKLAPTISSVVSALADDFSTLIKSITPKQIEEFGDGIKSFAEYLGSKETLQHLKDFMSAIGSLVTFINRITGHHTKTEIQQIKDFRGFNPELASQQGAAHRSWVASHAKALWYEMTGTGGGTMAQKQARLKSLEKNYGLPSGVLSSQWMQESSQGKNLLSPAGAMGDFGFMPRTAQSMGVNPWSFQSSSRGAAALMQENMLIYHGNLRKALAAYNWGAGNLNKDIAAHGGQWEQYAPKETQKYINQVIQRMRTPKIDITIENKTGANLYATTNAMAH